MNANEIFAQRLKNARVMKCFSMDDLVNAMGNNISKMAISKYEKCQLSPNSTIIISLAKALNQPVDYFFRPFSVQVNSIKFRKTKSNLAAKQENSIKEKVSDLIERYISIEEICTASIKFNSNCNEIILNDEQVKQAALQVRNEWSIGNDGIVNVITLLEEHGIKVMEIDAPESFDGLSSMVNDIYPVVILNKTYSSERKRFTALHELGHLILKFPEDIAEKDEEHYCNLFASEMLIPESVFKNIIGTSRHDISYQELKAIQKNFGISCDALMFKAKDCGIISEQRCRTYYITKNKNHAFKSMVENSIYPQEESLRFTSLVYRALSNELITTSKAASLLNQSVEQVREDLALV